MTQMGGHPIFLTPDQIGIGTRESASDVARSLSRWVDVLVARTTNHALVEELASVATIPVVNALTDLLHPCQVMADLLTISERMKLEEARVAFVGDGNNVANSLLLAASVLGLDLRLATPETHRPADAIRSRAADLAERSGARIHYTPEPRRGDSGRPFRLYGRLDEHGPGGAGRTAARHLRALPGQRQAPGERARGLDHARPARPPRGRDHGRRPRRTPQHRVRSGGEPPSRPEGDPGTTSPTELDPRGARFARKFPRIPNETLSLC